MTDYEEKQNKQTEETDEIEIKDLGAQQEEGTEKIEIAFSKRLYDKVCRFGDSASKVLPAVQLAATAVTIATGALLLSNAIKMNRIIGQAVPDSVSSIGRQIVTKAEYDAGVRTETDDLKV